MDKLTGVQGKIINFPYKDLQETIYDEDEILIEIINGILSVSIEDFNKIEKAKDLANLYLSQWSLRQGIKVYVEFDSGWKIDLDGIKSHFIEVTDSIHVNDRVIISTREIQGKARIVTQQMYDSASFSNDNIIVKKAQKYPVLKSAIIYYSEEVVEDLRPLYGIYKALEAIISYLDPEKKKGIKNLALLVNQPFSYVDDVMQTTQIKRHHKTQAIRKISDEECRQRAKLLIEAFANSLV